LAEELIDRYEIKSPLAACDSAIEPDPLSFKNEPDIVPTEELIESEATGIFSFSTPARPEPERSDWFEVTPATLASAKPSGGAGSVPSVPSAPSVCPVCGFKIEPDMFRASISDPELFEITDPLALSPEISCAQERHPDGDEQDQNRRERNRRDYFYS